MVEGMLNVLVAAGVIALVMSLWVGLESQGKFRSDLVDGKKEKKKDKMEEYVKTCGTCGLCGVNRRFGS